MYQTILNIALYTKGNASYKLLFKFQFETILKDTEDNLIRITNLWLESNDGQGQQKTIDKRDIISLTVLKDKGKNLPFDFTTKYGYLKLPYFETFQDTVGSQIVAVNVCTSRQKTKNIFFIHYFKCLKILLKRKIKKVDTHIRILILIHA